MKPFAFSLLSAIAVLIVPAMALSDQQGSSDVPLPFKHVTLYTSGVGYFQRSGEIDGDATDTLYFPLDQVNDILKSLVLLDEGGGSIQPVTYAAKDPIDKQLQAFTIDVSDNPDRASLFNRLRGANVTVTVVKGDGDTTGVAGGSLTGVVVGVETRTINLPASQSGAASQTTESFLNLLTADGIQTVSFEQIVAFKINDPVLEAELREALFAVGQARDANKRPVKLNFQGTGKREVRVGYVSEAPVWQSSYRLVLGKSPILQGWAVVQNTSEDDWNNIALTLVSGKPVSFIQDLYTPLYVNRPVIQSDLGQALNPVSYNAAENEQSANRASGVATYAAPMAADAIATNGTAFAGSVYALRSRSSVDLPNDRLKQMLSGSVGGLGAKLGESLFSYSIGVPVTIPRQQSAMIPFTSSPITADRVAIYNASVNAYHPMSGARLKNTTGLHLLGGPITVFDEGADTSYVGDAIMDDTEPNQTRLISFALDSPVDAKTDDAGGPTTTLGLKIYKGVLYVMVREQSMTTYKFKNNGSEAQTIVVEHPDPGSQWKITAPTTYSEHTATVYRYDLSLAAGESKSLDVVATHLVTETVGLIDDNEDNILLYMKNGAISDDVKAALQEIVTRKRAIEATKSQIAEVGRQITDITSAQDRIRENMRVLDRTAALYQRYSTELDAQETKLDTLNAKRDSLNADLNNEQSSLSTYLDSLTIGDLPAVTE